MFSEFDMEIEELLTPNAKIIRSPAQRIRQDADAASILVPSKGCIHDVMQHKIKL